jgi:pilus assembly protein CpaC
MVTRSSRRPVAPPWTVLILAAVVASAACPAGAQTTPPLPPEAPWPPGLARPEISAPAPPSGASGASVPLSIIHRVQAASERLEMVVNTSRILTTEQKIPQAQVNNPTVVGLTPLSPTEIQVSAKSAGVTQINLWDERNRITTIDVIVYGDAQELAMLLKSQFPASSLKVVPVGNGVLISGYVDQPEQVDLIVRIAEEYYPKVINAITVGGVQQVLLHVKVMEVSRTKLRTLGFDFAKITGHNVVASGVSGLLRSVSTPAGTTFASTGGHTFAFNVVDGSTAFFGLLDALRQDNLAKVLSEPTLVTVSGRPAYFNVGGEIPVPVPQSLGTISIEYKRYGTQLDFVPIVLGNGAIRLEVRPRVSELDPSRGVTINSTTVPGLRTREAETGVEMRAGQTLAIAGLVQTRTEAINRGLPWVSEVPYLGAPFRRVSEQTNEIELLILVTPELVEAMDAHEVPPCGPGLMTRSPNDWELYWRGHLEMPVGCPACASGAPCESCGEGGAIEPGAAAPPDGPPPGMILGPGEHMEAPVPAPQNRQTPPIPRSPMPRPAPAASKAEPAFIGPFGYDVLNY